MANSHIQPSMMAETQAICGDLLAPALLATNLTAPASGMTLPAFSTYGYVKNGTPTRLVYVNQAAAAVTVSGSAGAYWLALMHDTHSAVAGWTRQAGTHYCWQAAATQPADPPGGLVMAGVTVAGANITAVDVSLNYPHTKIAYGGPSGQLAFSSALTWDGATLKTTGALDVTGASVHRSGLSVPDRAGDNLIGLNAQIAAGGGTNRWSLYVGTAPAYFGGTLQVQDGVGLGGGGAPVPGYALTTYASAQLAANVTIGMLSTAATHTLDVNGTLRARSTLTCDATGTFQGLLTAGGGLSVPTNIAANTATFTGAVTVNGHLQGQATIHAATNLRAGGTLTVSGLAGFGREAEAGWQICAGGSILTYSNLQANGTGYFGGSVHCNSTLYVVGAVTAAGTLGVGAGFSAATIYAATSITSAGSLQVNGLTGLGIAPSAGWYLATPSAMITTLRSNGTLVVESTSQLLGSVAMGNLTPGYEGYSVHIAGAVKMRDQLRVDGIASRPGGGPWTDSNSMRRFKTNIAPLRDGLAALLALQERQWDWSADYPALEASLPGPRYGFVVEEVMQDRPQWVVPGAPGDAPYALQVAGFEALAISALREIVRRLEALERGI